jgi:hypothetical protein
VVNFGDGWLPNPETRLSKLADRISDLQRLAGEAGRERIPVTFFAVKPDADGLKRFAEAGVDRGLFFLPPASREELEPVLDHYAELAEAVAG